MRCGIWVWEGGVRGGKFDGGADGGEEEVGGLV